MPYFMTEDHCSIYYEERGPKDGKNVVFIHGGGCNRHFYKRNIPALAEKFHVLSYDQRLHGDSGRVDYGTYFERMAEDLNELLNYLGMKDVTLIGHSMGVNIIWQYIKDHGCENVAGVVVYEMSPRMLNDDEWNLGFGDAGAILDYYRMQGGHWEDIGFYWSAVSMFGEGDKDPDEVQWTVDQMKATGCPLPVYIQCCNSDYRDIVPKMTCPVLVTYGRRKSLYAPEVSEWIAEHTGGFSRIASFDGGHFCCWQDADNWNREVIDFIANDVK